MNVNYIFAAAQFLILLILFIIAILRIMWKKDDAFESRTKEWNSEGSTNKERINEMTEEQAYRVTTELVIKTLNKLECIYCIEDDKSIVLRYNSELYHILPNAWFLRIWDPRWLWVNADDPNLPALTKAMNNANYSYGPTIVTYADEKERIVTFHSRTDVLFTEDIRSIDCYLVNILDSFCRIQNVMRDRFKEIKPELEKEQKNRSHKVGFAAYKENDLES